MDNLFSTDIIGNPLLKAVSDFVSGENDIAGFFAIYSRNDEMADYLDLIIDYIRKPSQSTLQDREKRNY